MRKLLPFALVLGVLRGEAQMLEARAEGPDSVRAFPLAVVAAHIPVVCIWIDGMYRWKYSDNAYGAPHDFQWTRWMGDNYSGGFDIAGNAMYSAVITRSEYYLFRWSGFDPIPASVLGGLTAGFYQAYAKHHEGYYTGAKAREFVGAWTAILLTMGQTIEPEVIGTQTLARAQLQFSYRAYPGYIERPPHITPLDIYAYQKFFFMVRVGDLVFGKGALGGINIGVGGGYMPADKPGGPGDIRRYLFVVGYDLRWIIPGPLGDILNFYHLPLSFGVWTDRRGLHAGLAF